MGITSKDYPSNSRYKIEGIYGIKVHPSGAILRGEKLFTQYLNTEAGFFLWLKEQIPFKELTVYNLGTRRDETKQFIDKFSGV